MKNEKTGESTLSRIEWIDIAKALGVVLVVLGHTGLPEVFRRWIYIFHMPLFFYISGLFFKPVALDVAIKKKGKAYLLPYILFSAVFMMMNQLVDFGLRRVLEDMYRIITLRGTFPVLWFLTGLFFAEIIYMVAYQSITNNKEKLMWLSCFAGFCASAANLRGGANYLIWQSICEGLVFFAVGAYHEKPNKVKIHVSTGKCMVELLLTVLYAASFQKITISVVDISHGQMGIPVLNVVMALIGIHAILNVSILIEKCLNNFELEPVKRLILCVGENTLIFFPLMSYLPGLEEKVYRVCIGKTEGVLYDLAFKTMSCIICFFIVFMMKLFKSKNVATKMSSC